MSHTHVHTPEIKKGLINLLMFSLYSDERTIFREYVQNALDAINKAVEEGTLNATKDGWVKIDIDKNSNTISIKDNGSGIEHENAARVLLDISASQKNGIDQAGQFGIGRLVGGGYCHELIFKTSAKGDNKSTKVVFDVDKIWGMLEEPTDYLATTVIEKCTKVYYEDEEVSEHYFEVILRDIKSKSAPALLSIEGIIDYLCEVAPVEYKTQFETLIAYSSKDCPNFKDLHENLECVQLFVNEKRIQKQYGELINGTKDEIERLEYFSIDDPSLGTLGWGWFALTKFTIQIPSDDKLACIRLRKHNIQIGGRNQLSGRDYWRDERGNTYFYGEFFVTHPNIMPNAARDGLAPTPETIVLISKLKEYFTYLRTLYTRANEAKKSIDKIKDGLERMKKFGINDYNAKDLVDNKGIAKFEKLVSGASFEPIKRMLDLYKPAFEEAKKLVDDYKTELNKTNNGDKTPQPIEPDNTGGVSEPETKSGGRKGTPGEDGPGTNQPDEPVYPAGGGYGGPTLPPSKPDNAKPGNDNPVLPPAPQPDPFVGIRSVDIIKPLESVLDESEIWIIRRVFNVLDTYCPDKKLCSQLEKLIVKHFEND